MLKLLMKLAVAGSVLTVAGQDPPTAPSQPKAGRRVQGKLVSVDVDAKTIKLTPGHFLGNDTPKGQDTADVTIDVPDTARVIDQRSLDRLRDEPKTYTLKELGDLVAQKKEVRLRVFCNRADLTDPLTARIVIVHLHKPKAGAGDR